MIVVRMLDGSTFILNSTSLSEFMKLKKEGENFCIEKDGYRTILFLSQVSWVSDDPGKIR